MNEIARNLLVVNEKINAVKKIYNQKNAHLIAVSKNVDEARIVAAIEANCNDFGENYLQEAKEKWPKIKEKFSNIKLHFIGNFQSNKAKEIVELFDVIHSLPSKSAALALKKEMTKQQKNPEIFIQVNIGEEEQKSGILPSELEDFLKFTKELELDIAGLMCLPPAEELASPYFALLAKLAKKHNLEKLSMGMSNDFEQAIAMGAGYVRVGTAIFGERARIAQFSA